MRLSARKGFTLIEILLAMAIFAIGGVSILSLFLANATRAARAADRNRAAEIASSVRASLEASMLAPPVTRKNGNAQDKLYQLSFPQFTLSTPTEQATAREDAQIPVYFFKLPTEPFTGQPKPAGQYTVLPKELRDVSGAVLPPIGDRQPRVWYFKQTSLSRTGRKALGPAIDLDEREGYSFSFYIRRSVSRSDVDDGASKKLLDGLYVVQLRVFKGFEEGADNTPIEEFTFYITAAE